MDWLESTNFLPVTFIYLDQYPERIVVFTCPDTSAAETDLILHRNENLHLI